MITVFLPCRAGSVRIPEKNTKTFAGVEGGLLHIKLKQLIKTKNIDKVVLSTNDPKVIKIASEIESKKIHIDHRAEKLSTSSTSTDDLIAYVPSIIDDEHILWTHVTSPFISDKTYEKAINKYYSILSETQFDSLMSVNKIQTFIWNENAPINYDRAKEKWPRTQTLPSLFEINSGFFLSSRKNYIQYKDRIGKRPFLYETKHYESFDIDWPQDLLLAEYIYKTKKDENYTLGL